MRIRQIRVPTRNVTGVQLIYIYAFRIFVIGYIDCNMTVVGDASSHSESASDAQSGLIIQSYASV